MLMNRFVILLAGTLVAVAFSGGFAHAAGDGLYQRASGVEAYLGLVPAEITKGHEPTQLQGPMHGRVPDGSYQYHLVAAVFDADTGERITDAAVTAQVSGLGQVGPKKALEPMSIAGTLTFGGYIVLAGPGLYTISLTVKRPSSTEGITLTFPYEHGNR